VAVRPLPAALPLVTALLDVCDSDSSFRSSLRRLDFVLARVLTQGTQRYDQRAWGSQVPLGDRGKGWRFAARPDYIPDWLPSKRTHRLSRLNPGMQTGLVAVAQAIGGSCEKSVNIGNILGLSPVYMNAREHGALD